eukprot:11218355-Lingulodinium_polyedra.AAC.1
MANAAPGLTGTAGGLPPTTPARPARARPGARPRAGETRAGGGLNQTTGALLGRCLGAARTLPGRCPGDASALL